MQFLFKNVSMCCTYVEDDPYKEEGNTQAGGEGGQALSLSRLCTCETERSRGWSWFSGFLSHLLMVLLPDS